MRFAYSSQAVVVYSVLLTAYQAQARLSPRSLFISNATVATLTCTLSLPVANPATADTRTSSGFLLSDSILLITSSSTILGPAGIRSATYNISVIPSNFTCTAFPECRFRTFHALTPQPSPTPFKVATPTPTVHTTAPSTSPASTFSSRTNVPPAVSSATTLGVLSEPQVSNSPQASKTSIVPENPRPVNSNDPNPKSRSAYSSVISTAPSSTELAIVDGSPSLSQSSTYNAPHSFIDPEDLSPFDTPSAPNQFHESPVDRPQSSYSWRPTITAGPISPLVSADPDIKTITIGGQVYVAAKSGSDGIPTTLAFESVIAVGGTFVNPQLGSKASIPIQSDTPPPGISSEHSPRIFTLGDTVYTANVQGNFIIDSQTLQPNGPVVTVSGLPISLFAGDIGNPFGNDPYIVIGSTNTIRLNPSPPAPTATPTMRPNFITIGTQTLFLNGPAKTISGTTFSLAAAANVVTTSLGGTAPSDPCILIVNGNTTFTPLSSPTSYPNGPKLLLTVANSIYTENAASEFVIGTQTLSPGGTRITVSGTAISLASDNSQVFVGGSTGTLGLAGLIMSGLGDIDRLTALPSSTVTSSSARVTGLPSSSSSLLSNGPVFEVTAGQATSGIEKLSRWKFLYFAAITVMIMGIIAA